MVSDDTKGTDLTTLLTPTNGDAIEEIVRRDLGLPIQPQTYHWPGLGFPVNTHPYQWVILFNPPPAANDDKKDSK